MLRVVSFLQTNFDFITERCEGIFLSFERYCFPEPNKKKSVKSGSKVD